MDIKTMKGNVTQIGRWFNALRNKVIITILINTVLEST